MALFLVWHDGESVIGPDPGLALDSFELRPGLILVDSALDLSPLYHRMKWALPAGSALLVAPLAGAPKFKAMGKGALKRLRATARSGGPDRAAEGSAPA